MFVAFLSSVHQNIPDGLKIAPKKLRQNYNFTGQKITASMNVVSLDPKRNKNSQPSLWDFTDTLYLIFNSLQRYSFYHLLFEKKSEKLCWDRGGSMIGSNGRGGGGGGVDGLSKKFSKIVSTLFWSSFLRSRQNFEK